MDKNPQNKTNAKTKAPNPARRKPGTPAISSEIEGEGNRTADRNYRDAATRHADSPDVEREAREAERALEGDEREELEDAEAAGKGRA